MRLPALGHVRGRHRHADVWLVDDPGEALDRLGDSLEVVEVVGALPGGLVVGCAGGRREYA